MFEIIHINSLNIRSEHHQEGVIRKTSHKIHNGGFYPYVKENFKLIAIELSKQQALDADSKVIQQIRFSGSVERAGNTTIFFIIEEVK